jgi:hypothetical protein
MTLNASGPISLGGATTGQSINIELSKASTATVSLNDANVRSLAGVASGAITMPTNFYGKSVGFTYWYLSQTSSNGFSQGASSIDGSGNLYTANNGSSNAPTFTKVATLGAWQFSRRFTSGYYSQLTTASSGNSYACGSQSSDGFVVKYNSSGTLQWQRRISSASGSITIDSICIDPSENVYVLGTDTNGPVTFLMSYNSSGTRRWGRQISTGYPMDGRTTITYYDDGTSQALFGVAMTSPGGSENFIAFVYDTTGTFVGAISIASPTRDPVNDYIGVAYANPYFAISFMAYNTTYVTNYSTVITYNAGLSWQKELTNGGLINGFNHIATDGSNFYATGVHGSPYGLDVVKFTNTGTVSSQRTVAATLGLASSIASDGSVLSIGIGSVSSAGSFLMKAPINMSFGTAGSRTSGTSNWTTAGVPINDALGTQTSATGSYTEAAYTPTQTLTQLT